MSSGLFGMPLTDRTDRRQGRPGRRPCDSCSIRYTNASLPFFVPYPVETEADPTQLWANTLFRFGKLACEAAAHFREHDRVAGAVGDLPQCLPVPVDEDTLGLGRDDAGNAVHRLVVIAPAQPGAPT